VSIAERLKDAKLLYDHGRFEGALLSVLVAAAGTSRRRHPKNTKSDGDAFREIAKDALNCNCQVFIEGEWHPIEHFLYKWLRCEIAHEARLPDEVVFRPAASPQEAGIHSDCERMPDKVIVEHEIILVIGHRIASMAENADIPLEIRQSFSPVA
jgi:hypothetical protein